MRFKEVGAWLSSDYSFSVASSTFGNPREILFFARPPVPVAAGAPPAARLAAPFNPDPACAGALCLLLRFFSVSVAVEVEVAVAVVVLVIGTALPLPLVVGNAPALVIYANPSLWRLSVLSNLAGRNMSGNP
jgi:hypothetical protein